MKRLVKFFVGVEEVSATGTNHYTQFQMRNSTSHANECGRWGSASLIRRCTQFYTGDTHIGGYLAGFECESAKFGFYHDYRFSKLCIEFSFSKDFTKIVKGECRDKRKPRFRFDYDEPQPIFVLTKIVKGECRDKRKYCIRFGYA